MLPLIPLLSVLLAPPVTDGTWLPTPGPGGQEPVSTLAVGGEGALYAAGGGRVYRLVPGEAWQPLGVYAPTLRWTGDEAIEAEGPFDPAVLERVAEEAERAIEVASGLELTDANLTEDLVEGLLEAYVAEDEPSPDSAWAIGAIAPANRGVWLGTGAGLFRVDVDGVRGPLGTLAPIVGLDVTQRGLVALTPNGTYRVDDNGQAELWLARSFRDVAAYQGRAALVSDDAVLIEVPGDQLGALEPPTGRPTRLAADGTRLWVVTELALYAYEAGHWRLCAPVPGVVTDVAAADGVVAVATESALHLSDVECQTWARFELPWPGSARFNGALWSKATLWAATGDGVFALAPRSAEAEAELKAAAFMRAIESLPSFEALVRAALDYQALDRESNSYGYRPVLRGLLPDLSARVTRAERDPLTGRQSEELEFRVVALWKIQLDVLTSLFDVERDLVNEDLTDQSIETDGDLDLESLEADTEVVTVDIDTGSTLAAESLESVALYRLAAQRRLLRRDRRALVEKLRRLYRERMRVMHRLWLGTPGPNPTELVMRLKEIDGGLDALTGAAFSRLMENR